MITRRTLLKHSAFVSLVPTAPSFLVRTALAARPERDSRILVVIQLDGGNDGINTVIPYADEAYAKLRPTLRIPPDKICKIADGVGLHPAMKAAADLVESGRLAVVQGVGYPNPDRSHFRSMAIWQTAQPGRPSESSMGWLGRALDADSMRPEGPAGVYIGDRTLPRALTSRRAVTTSFSDASDLSLVLPPTTASAPSIPASDSLADFVSRTVTNSYTAASSLEAAARRTDGSGARYPSNEPARQFDLVARSIKAGSRARVYYVIQPGYDTHALQLPTQSRLLGELAGALKAFLDDLAAAKLADRVVVMAFSEFGRRLAENGSIGTDHGTAGPVFIAGAGVKAGLVGETPRLNDLEAGDLKWSIDFRRVYATLLDQWLDVPSATVLGETFKPLALLKA